MVRKIILSLLCFCWLAQGQVGSGNATRIQGRPVAATAPSDTNTLCWDAGNRTWKPCTAGGAGGVTPGGPDTAVQVNHPAGTFAGDASKFQSIQNALTPPSAPVLSTVGTAGATTLGYQIAWHLPTGDSVLSTETLITTANAVLDGTNYVTVTVPACPSVTGISIDIFVSTPGGNIPDFGWLANVSCSSVYNHQGLDADGDSIILTVDTTLGQFMGKLTIGDSPPNNLISSTGGFSQDAFGREFGLLIGGAKSFQSQMALWAVGTTPRVDFITAASSGSIPTSVSNGDLLGIINAHGYDGRSWDNGTVGFEFHVDGTPSIGFVPTEVRVIANSKILGKFRADGSTEFFGGPTKVAGVISAATKFTISGCSAGTTLGGATAGSFVSGTTGTCTVTITMNGATGLTAPSGWTCDAHDLTTPTNGLAQTATTTATATITGTTVSGDLINFKCTGY